MEQPLIFTIDVRDFDPNLLDQNSRQIGTDRFAQAVTDYFAQQFQPVGGDVRVAVGGQEITVSWTPDGSSISPTDYAISLLREGRQAEAIRLLRLLLAALPDDDTVLYNLGLAESDLGNLAAAISLLTRATEIDPRDANVYVGLGVAQQRFGDGEGAVKSLARAVELQPENGYARLNLGAVLATLDRHEEARRHLRDAVRLMPDSQQALFGLAYELEQSGNEEQITEANVLYQQAIALDPQSKIAEQAEGALRELAQRSFHKETGIPVRMDSVLYCLEGLRMFSKMTKPEVEAVAFEIGMLAARGLDINDSTPKYTLRSLSGTYSGLHLLSLMYVGFKQVAPDQDIGFDLTNEYALAQQMFAEEKPSA